MLKSGPNGSLYFKRDRQYNVPRTYAYFLARVPAAMRSLRNTVLKRLWTDIVDEALSEVSDQAAVGGLGYTLGCDTEGFLIALDGYSPQLGELLNVVLKAMKGGDVPDPAVFDRVYDSFGRDLANFNRTSPGAQCGLYARHLRVGHAWLPEEKVSELQSAFVRRWPR